MILEPEHLTALTPAQREELRLWHGRVHLLDRIKATRGYALLTVAAIGFGLAGFAAGVDEIPPLVLSPIVPLYMTAKLWRRAKSLRLSGLKLRRVFLMPRAKWVLPAPPPPTAQLEKLAPREVLESPQGAAIRRAAEDRAAILAIIAALPKADRALLPDVVPTVNALVDRVAQLAQMLHRLEQSIDLRLMDELKDQEVDRALFRDRPLPSGRIHEADIVFTLWVGIALFLAPNLAAVAPAFPSQQECASRDMQEAARSVRKAEAAVVRAAKAEALWLNAQEALGRAKAALARGEPAQAACAAEEAIVFAELGVRQLQYPPYRAFPGDEQ